jgi:hypothetical protein
MPKGRKTWLFLNQIETIVGPLLPSSACLGGLVCEADRHVLAFSGSWIWDSFGSTLGQMVHPILGQLSPSLVVFDDEASPYQERFCNLADRAARQRQYTGDNVQSGCSAGQDFKIPLLGRSQSHAVDLFQRTGTMKMFERDGIVALGPSTTASGLKETKGEAWCPLRSFGDFGKDRLIDSPPQCLAPMSQHFGQLCFGIELKSKQEPHAVPTRLQ